MHIQRENGAIAGVLLDDLQRERASYLAGKADFNAHMNAPGTWLDFGKLATDGSVKINKEEKRLTVFPYPRDRAFTLEIDLASFGAEAGANDVRVTAQKAGSQESMGPVPVERQGSRIKFQTGLIGCGRYIVEWVS